MAALTYDGRSFLLDGERIWIAGGEVHYFRHPRAEWRVVLLRARRAGLNTIATYVPWNFHEIAEGVADFEGDKDLTHYLDLIAELGMWAMVRPGPYICSEWDGGGIPAWLNARPVRRFREDDPVYVAAVESWFDRLLPIVSSRQVTKGGPVITVQNENEYPGGWDDSMRGYVRKLNDLFGKHGIHVPVLACNVHGASPTTVKINDSTDPRDQLVDPEMILTYNHHTDVDPVHDLRAKQPDAPLVASEFWSGAPVYWGDPVTDWPDAVSLARAAYEYASAGTQLVYYMFEGGTNFGFWAGNNIATSYASGYPVGEGGLLTEKYYAIRPANLFATQFADVLAGSSEVPFAGPEGMRLVARRSSFGDLVFLSAPDGRRETVLDLPGGRRLPVRLGDVPAAVLPVRLTVFDGVVVDYGNLCLLARDERRRVLVMFGPAGTDGVVSLNGEELLIPVHRRAATHRQVAGISLVVVDEELARRCWIAGDHLLLGPDYVGGVAADGSVQLDVSPSSPPVVRLDASGTPVQVPVPLELHDPDPPELAPWTVSAQTGTETWQSLVGPFSHERLGVTQGYVWYAADLHSDRSGVQQLLLTHAPNRVSVFVNGTYAGTHAERRSVRMRDEYAHPADWAFEQLTVPLTEGRNELVFLSDDLGHNYDVPAPVGIQGPVYAGSRRLEIRELRELDPAPVSADAFEFLYDRSYREPAPLPAVELDLALGPDELAFVTIHGVHAWVLADGADVPPLSFPESPWTMFTAIKRWLTWAVPEGARTVQVRYSGGTAQSVRDNLTVYVVPKSGRCVNWRWRPWGPDAGAGSAATVPDDAERDDQLLVLLPSGDRVATKGRSLTPSWFETSFPMPPGDRPVYLRPGDLRKGQIYLNGHNVGRFWQVGRTQERYYLPRSWMLPRNRLTVFEELGIPPRNAGLEYGGSRRWSPVTIT